MFDAIFFRKHDLYLNPAIIWLRHGFVGFHLHIIIFEYKYSFMYITPKNQCVSIFASRVSKTRFNMFAEDV